MALAAVTRRLRLAAPAALRAARLPRLCAAAAAAAQARAYSSASHALTNAAAAAAAATKPGAAGSSSSSSSSSSSGSSGSSNSHSSGVEGLNAQSELSALFRMREPVRIHAVTPPQPVPAHIARPPYVHGEPLPSQRGDFDIKTPADIAAMRVACRVASEARAYAGTLVTPGRTTDDIDRLVHAFIVARNAYPSPLGYRGFPKSVCTSVNEVVCHGIPDARPLREGDIVNVDVSVYAGGWHGDCSATFCVGAVDSASAKLVADTKQAMDLAIAACRPGAPLNVIGAVIADFAEPRGYGIVETYAGHGIGRHFHLPPTISHFRNDDRRRMRAGMVFTIEPMLTEGDAGNYMLADGWTIVTADGKRSAQFEETIVVTETGAEVLTKH